MSEFPATDGPLQQEGKQLFFEKKEPKKLFPICCNTPLRASFLRAPRMPKYEIFTTETQRHGEESKKNNIFRFLLRVSVVKISFLLSRRKNGFELTPPRITALQK
jgi:hypothetical protein